LVGVSDLVGVSVTVGVCSGSSAVPGNSRYDFDFVRSFFFFFGSLCGAESGAEMIKFRFGGGSVSLWEDSDALETFCGGDGLGSGTAAWVCD